MGRYAGFLAEKTGHPQGVISINQVTVFRPLQTGGCFMTEDRDLVIGDKLIQLPFFLMLVKLHLGILGY